MAISAAGLILLVLLQAGTTLAAIIGCLALLGLGFGLFSSPNTNAVMSSVDKRQLGIAAATLATMRLTGQMLSMGLALLVIALSVGRVRITPEHHAAFLGGLRTAFLLFGCLCGAGVFASLARGKVR
jgi:hypothetical protein